MPAIATTFKVILVRAGSPLLNYEVRKHRWGRVGRSNSLEARFRATRRWGWETNVAILTPGERTMGNHRMAWSWLLLET